MFDGILSFFYSQGQNLDTYLPNPAAVSPLHIQMFEYVGKLLGIAIRTKNPLPFSLPSLVWKPLVGEEIGGTNHFTFNFIRVFAVPMAETLSEAFKFC